GEALTVPSGENAPMKPDVSVQGVAYNVVNNFSNKCLETTQSVRNDNANVAQRSCATGTAAQTQQWTLDPNGDGTYRLINRNSRKALSVLGCGKGDGANVVQAAWTATACQSWQLTPTANGYVRIDEPTSGKTLDVAMCYTSEDVDVRLWGWVDGSPCQQWRLQPIGAVAVANVNSGKLLGTDCGASTGTAVTLRFYDRSLCETWTFASAGGAAYTARNSSGQCLGIRGGSTADGAVTVVGSCSSARDQQWHLVPQSDGTFGLSNVGSGKFLDVDWCGIADGNKVGQFGWLDNDCQRFRLTALEPVRYPTPVGPLYPAEPRAVTGDIGVHDPTVVKRGDDTYLLASTGKYVSILTSPDGYSWKYEGPAFNDTPWARNYLTDSAGKVHDWLWAPDVSFHNGRYYMYYSASTFGSQKSAIFLATSPTGAPGSWTPADGNGGKVVESSGADNFNAIDPNLFVDADGSWWMAFGSWWSGIKMVKLDPRTGLRDMSDPTVRSLAGRPDQPGGNQALEGPSLIRHGGKYYLFVAYDVCCNGVNSTYRVMVGRADQVTGPYLDAEGRPMTDGFATQVLASHDGVAGPGHQAVFRDGDRDLLVYHYYVPEGYAKIGINPLKWESSSGRGDWPVVTADPGRSPSPTQPPVTPPPVTPPPATPPPATVPPVTPPPVTPPPVTPPPGGADCSASLRIDSDWGSGFTATVTVTNRGSSTTKGWRVTWTWPGDQKFVNAWNGDSTQTGAAVTTVNGSWNGPIPAGGSATFGFQATGRADQVTGPYLDAEG
ncbi:MAG TPA: RICIN domain-containing protein, partial [Actinoplanes sp.]|nr:RICIN domain-containing protein [Actinoplanes sp.]